MKEENNISNKKRGRVLFISPLLLSNQDVSFLPNDIMYLASVAEESGYEAKIKNYSDKLCLISILNNFAPDYIVFDVSFQNFREDMEVLALLKEHKPNVKIIVKGEPFITYNTNVTYENPFIDYVIVGEAEMTLKDILDGVKDSEIKGICYKDDNMQPVKNEPRPFIENLDILPFPARHLIYSKKDKKAIIEISRGCPNDCFFCLTPLTSGTNVRIRSAENIISEIEECTKKYGIKYFLLKSDAPDLEKDYIIKLCKKITDSGLKVQWETNIIPSENDTAILMKKSGCTLIHLGVESGSQEILSNIGRKFSLDNIRKTSEIIKQSRIKIHNHFILGLPWETEKTAEETIKFALELDSNCASFYIASPFPGTRFFAYAMINKLIYRNLDFKNAYHRPVIKTHDLSKERVYELYKSAYRRYYLRLGFIIKTLLKLRTLEELRNYILIYEKLLIKQEKNG